MKAAYITETGAPTVIQYGDLPSPEPQRTEVLVQVGAVAVNPIDTYIRAGIVPMPLKFPYIIGCDLAGTVVGTGAGVTRFKVGDRVWGSNQSLFGRAGTFAELAAVDEKWLYPTPEQLTDAEAAAGALVGITAYLGLFRFGRLQPNEIVFVNGGTGGVGSSVIQMAEAGGARVIATAGNAAKLERCRALGATLALDYHAPDLDDQIRNFVADNGGVNVWYETQREPTFDRTVGLMAPRGRIILMAGRQARPEFPVGPFYVKDLSLLGFAMFNASPDEQREAAKYLHDMAVRGDWTAQIGKIFPLSQAAAAHQLQQDNTLDRSGTLSGKIVLVPDSLA